MIQRPHLSPYEFGKHMATHGGTLRGLHYGPGAAQDAAVLGFQEGMQARKAKPPLFEVDLNGGTQLPVE